MSVIIFNKKILPSEHPCISHNDRGFTLGHGLFETILVKKNTFPALDYHWKRLEVSAPILGITLPFCREELEHMLHNLVIRNNLQAKIAAARVTITHGESERGILPRLIPKPNFLIAVSPYVMPEERPFSALIVNTRRNEHSPTARVKSISYLDNILARKEALEQQCDEAIMLNTSSKVADGAISTIYMVKNNQISTPPIEDGALPGVIRSILLEEYHRLFQIIEKSITPGELLLADEVFLTNALMGVKSIGKINFQELHCFAKALEIGALLRDKKNYI